MLENVVTVVANSYEVVLPIPDFCKSDLSVCHFVEEFLWISHLELICVMQEDIYIIYRYLYKFIIIIILWTILLVAELNWPLNENCMKCWITIEKVNQSGFRVPVKYSICLIIHNESGVL